MKTVYTKTAMLFNGNISLGKLWIILMISIMISVRSAATTRQSIAPGNWNNPGTWSGNAVPTAADDVIIDSSVTLSSAAGCANLTVRTGRLSFGTSSGRGYTLSVSGNVFVVSTIDYPASTTGNYFFRIGGNLTNYGIMNLYAASNRRVDLVFDGSTNARVARLGSGSFNLGNVQLNKSTRNSSLDVTSNAFESSIKNLIAIQGTYIHDTAGLYQVNPTQNFVIAPQVIFHVPTGTMNFSALADTLILQGELHVTGGTVNVGRPTGIAGIVYDKNDTSVIPFLNITSGSMNVKGGIAFNLNSGGEPFRFNMSDGMLLLNSGTTGTSRQVFYINDVTGSSFSMSNGTIVLAKPNVNGSVYVTDFAICGTRGTVTTTGGTVQFGTMTGMISKGFNFTPFYNTANPSWTFPHITALSPAPVNGSTLSPAAMSTSNFNVLSLQIGNLAKFDMRSIDGNSSGDGRVMSIKGAASGIGFGNAGTFAERTGTVRFFPAGSTTVPQRITGSGPYGITFYRLDISNASGVTLNTPVKVSNYLSLSNGKLNTTTANLLTCLSNATTSSGGINTFVNGPMIHTAASTSSTKYFPIGKDSDFRPVELMLNHASTDAVTYEGEVINLPANTLPACLPPTITSVSNVRYTRFTRIGTSRFISGSITMHYGSDDGVTDANSLVIAQDAAPMPPCWIDLGQDITGTSSPVLGWIRSDIGIFNPTAGGSSYFQTIFSLANPTGGTNALPVSLTTFEGELTGNRVKLNWSTNAEFNCDRFAIERASSIGDFEPIGNIHGSGTTSDPHAYLFTDDQPLTGTSYYRLRQIDYDGSAVIYGPVLIRNGQAELTVYPNPSNGTSFHVRMGDPSIRAFDFKLQDAIGQTVPFHVIDNGAGDMIIEPERRNSLPGAFYVLSASSGDERWQKKIIIQ